MSALTQLVARHRDAHSPTLGINWALLRLLDEHGSSQLRTDLSTEGCPWEVLQAQEHAWHAVPDAPGLYMFVWRPWFSFDLADDQRRGDLRQVLYVGKAGADDSGNRTSGGLKQRYRDYNKHLRVNPEELWLKNEPEVPTRSAMLDRYLCLRPMEYWYTIVPRHSEIPLLEDRLIKLLNPPCNRQRTPRIKGRFGSPQPALRSPQG